MLADPGGVAGVVLSIAAGITGLAQIAAIIAAPLPEFGTGDWLRSGPKHREAGRGTQVLIERDEAVIAANAMTDPNTYTVTGTTAQITSALNSRGGGISWAGGAVVDMPRWRTERPASINPNMARIMEQGGLVRPIEGNASQVNNNETNALLKQLITEQQANTEEIKTMKTRLHAVVSIKEYREEEARFENAKKVSGLNQ